jgi:hypothetical protein
VIEMEVVHESDAFLSDNYFNALAVFITVIVRNGALLEKA